LEIVAPGVNIESTFKEGSYAILSGTSMAAAHAAGLAARVWKKDVERPAQVVRTVLHAMAKDTGNDGDDDASGWGIPRY
jgi:subtilisin family serine protease